MQTMVLSLPLPTPANEEGAAGTSIRELLSYKHDLCGTVRKAHLLGLSKFCDEPLEARAMQWLCSKCSVGKAMWECFVEQQRLGFAELLLLFPSCHPPLGAVLAYANPMVPRYYSVSSSPMSASISTDACTAGAAGAAVYPASLSIAFSVVHYTCTCVLPALSATTTGSNSSTVNLIQRAGLCTSYLEKAAQSFLYPQHNRTSVSGSSSGSVPASAPLLRIFHKSSISFRLPGSVAPPLILIGPGTGVAPFVGFLQHRQCIEQQRVNMASADDACEGVWRGGFEIEEEDLPGETVSEVQGYIQDVCPGPVHLYFGCRNDDDFLYEKQLQAFCDDGTLTSLDVAKSRVQDHKVYVTHKLHSRSQEIANLVLSQGAYIYVCGDGNGMAKDVSAAITAAFVEHGDMTTEEATELIATLKCKRRFALDIWS